MNNYSFKRFFTILGIAITLMGQKSFSVSAYDLDPPDKFVTNNGDKFLSYMRETSLRLTEDEKVVTSDNYVKGILSIFQTDKTVDNDKIVRGFARDYLNACFNSYEEMSLSYRSMVSSLMGRSVSEECSGEWVGADGFLSLCDDGTVHPIGPALCIYQCVDPYTAQDCTLYFPCGPE